MRRFVGLIATSTLTAVLTACAGSPPPAPVAESTVTPTHSHPVTLSEPPAAPLRGGERFVRLEMPRPYTPAPPNGGTDEYRCFLVDPKLAKKSYVTGSQFLPQNPALVHHAIFFRIEPGDVAAAKRLDANTPGDGWTCFGGPGVGGRGIGGGGSWIAAWAPGAAETLLGSRTGYVMEAGSQLVMQVHYNLLATNGKPQGTDQSGLRLRVVDGSAKLTALRTTLLPAPVELPCAKGESGPLCDRNVSIADVGQRFGSQAVAAVGGLALLCNKGQPSPPGPTQHCDQVVRQAGTVYAVAGHMHLLGRSIKVELNPGTSRAKVLLDVPVYNFDDQSARVLAKPVSIKAGDTYRVTCTHDATLRARLPELKPLKPRYVVWGDGTSDEMCLGIVVWAPRA